MPIVAPTPVTPLSTPPSTSDPANFDSRADNFLGQLPTTATQINDIGTNVFNNATETLTNANAAAVSKQDAQTAAVAAGNASNASKWVSGTNYAEGAVVWSPINGQGYRKKTAGVSNTDPSTDSTNWFTIGSFATASVVPDFITQSYGVI